MWPIPFNYKHWLPAVRRKISPRRGRVHGSIHYITKIPREEENFAFCLPCHFVWPCGWCLLLGGRRHSPSHPTPFIVVGNLPMLERRAAHLSLLSTTEEAGGRPGGLGLSERAGEALLPSEAEGLPESMSLSCTHAHTPHLKHIYLLKQARACLHHTHHSLHTHFLNMAWHGTGSGSHAILRRCLHTLAEQGADLLQPSLPWPPPSSLPATSLIAYLLTAALHFCLPCNSSSPSLRVENSGMPPPAAFQPATKICSFAILLPAFLSILCICSMLLPVMCV